MVNLTLSEATLNAVRAALDERVARLEGEVRLSAAWADMYDDENSARALVWNIAALHETKTAVEDFAEPEQADAVTAAKAYAELGYHAAQAAYGPVSDFLDRAVEREGYGFDNPEGDPSLNGAFG